MGYPVEAFFDGSQHRRLIGWAQGPRWGVVLRRTLGGRSQRRLSASAPKGTVLAVTVDIYCSFCQGLIRPDDDTGTLNGYLFHAACLEHLEQAEYEENDR